MQIGPLFDSEMLAFLGKAELLFRRLSNWLAWQLFIQAG